MSRPAGESAAPPAVLHPQLDRSAKDKPLNRALARAVQTLHERQGIELSAITMEQGVHGLSLIPDIAVQKPGVTLCIEPTWRKGNFLVPAHRSTVA